MTLQTTISEHVLQSVSLTGVNGNWCGDVEEPDLPFVVCTGSPDPYFGLTNAGGGTFTSGSLTDVNTDWSALGLVLDNPPYSISFYEGIATAGALFVGA